MKIPKIAFIGSKNIYTVLKSEYPNWDFQQPFESVSDFENAAEQETLADDTCVVISNLKLYNNNTDDFLNLALYAQNVVVCLLYNEKSKHLIPLVEKSFKKTFTQNEMPSDTPFYFINASNYVEELEEAFQDYIVSPHISDEALTEVQRLINNEDSNHDDLTIEDATFIETEHDMEEEDDEDDFYEEDLDDFSYPEPDKDAFGKVICVTSSKGGVGKSTTSLTLASALYRISQKAYKNNKVERPLRVLVVDCDVRDSQLGFFHFDNLDKPNIVTIYNDYSANKDYDENYELTIPSILKGINEKEDTNLDYDLLLATKKSGNADFISPSLYGEIIQKLRSHYDYIIVDTSVNYQSDRLLSHIIFPLSDMILFVVGTNTPSIEGMNRWIWEVVKENTFDIEIDENKVGIVVANAMNNVGATFDTIQEKADGLPILTAVPSKTKLFQTAINNHSVSSVLDDPDVKKSLDILCHAILPKEYL